MVNQILAVFLVLGLLVLCLALLKKKGIARFNMGLPRRAAASKEIHLLDRVTLTPHHSLHLVRVRDRVILVGVSPSGCNSVESFPAEKELTPLEAQS